jgi:hypothetical protein
MGGRGRGGSSGGQRFHKGHVGRMVVPGVSGFLFSVDPQSSNKAERELGLLFAPFAPVETTACSAGRETPRRHGEEQEQGGSIANALLRELEEAKQCRVATGAVGDSEKASIPKQKRTERWFTVLDTNCKGYVFLNVPQEAEKGDTGDHSSDDGDADERPLKSRRTEDPPAEHADEDASSAELGGACATTGQVDGAKREGGQTSRERRFPLNWRVADVSERLFEDLCKNPRPVVRFSHRCYPVLTTCYPTVACLTHVVKDIADCLELPANRSAVKLGLIVTVRNNSKVDAEKLQLRAALEKSLPMNRFLVLPTGRPELSLDAVIFVFVLQSTACVGVCTDYSQRYEYNLHAASQASLVLDKAVKTV